MFPLPFRLRSVIGQVGHDRGEVATGLGLVEQPQAVVVLGQGQPAGGDSTTEPAGNNFALGVTVLWTLVNVLLHVAIGVALALLLPACGLLDGTTGDSTGVATDDTAATSVPTGGAPNHCVGVDDCPAGELCERVQCLDSACVYGERLTAWCHEDDRIVQIASAHAY